MYAIRPITIGGGFKLYILIWKLSICLFDLLIFVSFTATWGKDPFWPIVFSDGWLGRPNIASYRNPVIHTSVRVIETSIHLMFFFVLWEMFGLVALGLHRAGAFACWKGTRLALYCVFLQHLTGYLPNRDLPSPVVSEGKMDPLQQIWIIKRSIFSFLP